MSVPLVSRITTAALERAAQVLWGFQPNLMPHLIAQRGAAAGLSWFVRNMPRYELTRRAFGPIRTHILATTISIFNGCEYCTYGHAYALELCYLNEHGSLFPLDESEFIALGQLSESEASAGIERALNAAGLGADVDIVRRLLALRTGSLLPEDADDRRLQHLLEMLGVLNSCGIRGKVKRDQAHDPINRNRLVKQRYAELRRHAGSQVVEAPVEVVRPAAG